jgi:hypothetical protein
MPPQVDNFKGTVLRHLTALLIIAGLLGFLYFALLDPNLASLTEGSEGIIVGGFVSIITLVVNSLFQSEATKQASRAAQDATSAGATAAMTSPTPSPIPTAVEITDPVTVVSPEVASPE